MQSITIASDENQSFQVKEAYKSLRTNILFCGTDVKVIALTSCMPNEGKSSVSFELALSLAESGKKVVFVDADLRKSVIMKKHKVGQKVNGMSHYLSGQVSLSEVVYQTNFDNLHMVFTGPVPPNPAELLGNAEFEAMIDKFREEYDYVVIDTPPLGSVVDTAVVSRCCDGIALVVAARSTNYKFAQMVKAQIEKTGCRFLGVILNKIQVNEKSYYGKYYGRYYGSYYGKEE